MCGRFHYLSYDEVLDVIFDIEMDTPPTSHPDWPAVRPNAYPKTAVPLIKEDEEGRLFPETLRWGFEVDWSGGVIFNTRVESANKPLWHSSFSERRCLVPAYSFFEPHQFEKAESLRTHKFMKRPYEFFMPDHEIMLMGAIWRDDSFSIVTTQPNASVAPVHARMPLVIRPHEIPQWFGAEYLLLANRENVVLQSVAELPLAKS